MNAALIVGWGLVIGLGVLVFRGGRAVQSRSPAQTQAQATAGLAAGVSGRYSALEIAITGILAQQGMAGSTVVACVLDSSGDVVFSFNGEQSFVPASALKTVTTATALEKLGPDFRFRTLLLGTAPFPAPLPGEVGAPMESRVYEGDLVILGGGDPSFATEHLIAWGAEIAALGITEIRGRIIGDGKVFPELTAAKAWDWGDVGNYYGAPAAGLNIDGNRYAATFRPGAKVGDPAVLMEVLPEVPGVTLFNRMLTSEAIRSERDAPYAYGGPYSPIITFRGAVPVNASEEVVAGAVPDPVFSASARLHRLLGQRGVTVTGEPTTSLRLELEGESPPVPSSLHPGLAHESEPLIALIRHTHRFSDNLYAECLFRLMALERRDGDGQAAVTEHWRNRGAHLQGLRMEDGSGLARADLIRGVDLARINFLTRHGEHGAAFLDSLIPQFDGKMRWKGGAMSRIRSYVGFTLATSEELTFVLGFNHFDADSVTIARCREQLLQVLSGM